MKSSRISKGKGKRQKVKGYGKRRNARYKPSDVVYGIEYVYIVPSLHPPKAGGVAKVSLRLKRIF